MSKSTATTSGINNLDAITSGLKESSGVKKIGVGQFAIPNPGDASKGIGYKKNNETGNHEFGEWSNLETDTPTFTEKASSENLVRANIQGRSAYAWLFGKDIPKITTDPDNEFIALSPTNNPYYLAKSGEFVKLSGADQDKISYDDPRYAYLVDNLEKLVNDEKTFEQLLEAAQGGQAQPQRSAQETQQDEADTEFVKGITLRAFNQAASDTITLAQKEERKKYLQDLAAIQGQDATVITQELEKLKPRERSDSLLYIFYNIATAINTDESQADKQKITQDLAQKFAKFSDTLSDDKMVAYGQITGFLYGKDTKEPPQDLDDSLNIRKGESAKAHSAIDAQKDALETSFNTAFEARMNALNSSTRAVQDDGNRDPAAPNLVDKTGLSDAEKEKMGTLRKGVVIAGQVAAVAALAVTASPLVAALAAGALLWWYSKQTAAQKDLETQKELSKLQKEETAFKKALGNGENFEMAPDVRESLQAQEARGQAPRARGQQGTRRPAAPDPQPPEEDLEHHGQGAAGGQPDGTTHVADVTAMAVHEAEATIQGARENLEAAQDNIGLISQMEARGPQTGHASPELGGQSARNTAARGLDGAGNQEESLYDLAVGGDGDQNSPHQEPVYAMASPSPTITEIPTYDLASPQSPSSQPPSVVAAQPEPLYDNATAGEITGQQPAEDAASQSLTHQTRNPDQNTSSTDRQAIQNELAQVASAIADGNSQAAPQPQSSPTPTSKRRKPSTTALRMHSDGEGSIDHRQGGR